VESVAICSDFVLVMIETWGEAFSLGVRMASATA
jgi:hypothetical protein